MSPTLPFPHPVQVHASPRRPVFAAAVLLLLTLALLLPAPAQAEAAAASVPARPSGESTTTAAPKGTPTAFTSAGYRATGALFPHGTSGRHTCTGSVVRSASHDLVLTAAHCLNGTASNWTFVPKYMAGKAPFGTWKVVHAYLPASWLSRQDSRHDYAVLQLAKQKRSGHTVGVQDVVGGYTIGSARSGEAMRAPGYNAGRNDRPISCAVHARYAGAYPAFDCHGYRGGTSGTPWLITVSHGKEIHGLIGGLHHGGCVEYTSYSSPFTRDVAALVARGERRSHPDRAPRAGDDGC